MVYPTNDELLAGAVVLDPARYSGLLNGQTNLEDALRVLDQYSVAGERVRTNLLIRDPVVVAGTWLREVSGTASIFRAWYTNRTGPGGVNDEIIVNLFVPSAGTWTLNFNGSVGPSWGIVKLYNGAVQIGAGGGYDFYAGGFFGDNVISVAGLVLAAGLMPLHFKVTGKNPLSTGYTVTLGEINLVRTA